MDDLEVEEPSTPVARARLTLAPVSPSRSESGGLPRSVPATPRLEAKDSFADRMFSAHSELIPVPHEPSKRFSFRTLLSYIGPGLLTSVAFVDPGNIESDLQAGAYAGYSLLWVVALSTTVGLLFQSLSARLGTVTGKDLATNCSEHFGGKKVVLLWCMTQIAIIGSDIQEIVGSAVAFRLLFGLPLWAGCLLTGLDTLTFLGLHASGIRKLEAAFAMMILTMVICFFANFFMTGPDPQKIVEGIMFPKVTRHNAIQAASILGAVIMPHNIYLHSALVLSRDVDRTKPREIREANFYFTLEAAMALFVAFCINTAIVSVFAHGFFSPTCEKLRHPLVLKSTFREPVYPPYACVPMDHDIGMTSAQCVSMMDTPGTCQPIGLQVAGKPLETLLGSSSTILWAIGLLAAGQCSTVTGTYAGQFVMEGMLNLSLPNWQRVAITRMVALIPATIVALIAADHYLAADRLDEWLNVVQSVQLPFAIIPLLTCCGDKMIMGEFSLSRTEKILGWGIGGTVIIINIVLLGDHLSEEGTSVLVLAALAGVFYLWFLKQFTPSGKAAARVVAEEIGSTEDERRQLVPNRGDVEEETTNAKNAPTLQYL